MWKVSASLPIFLSLLHPFLPHSFFLHFPPSLFVLLLLLFFNTWICDWHQDSCPQRWNVTGSVQQTPFPDDACKVTWLMQIFIPPTPPHSPLPPPLPSNPQNNHDHGSPRTSCYQPTDIVNILGGEEGYMAKYGLGPRLRPYFVVYPELSPHTDIIYFLEVTLWSFWVLPSEVG